jgi:hypothetical protein
MKSILRVFILLLLTVQCAFAQQNADKLNVEIDSAYSCPYNNAFITLKLRITNTQTTPIYVLRSDVEQTMGVAFYSGGSGIVISNAELKLTDEFVENKLPDSIANEMQAYYDTLFSKNDKYLADSFDTKQYFLIKPKASILIYTQHDLGLNGYVCKPLTPQQKKVMQTSLVQNVQYYKADKATMDVMRFRTTNSTALKQAFLQHFE